MEDVTKSITKVLTPFPLLFAFHLLPSFFFHADPFNGSGEAALSLTLHSLAPEDEGGDNSQHRGHAGEKKTPNIFLYFMYLFGGETL